MKSPSQCVLAACVLALTLTLAFVAGCDDAQQPRSRLTITQILPADATSDLAYAPYESDIRDIGSDGEIGTEDDVVYEDHVVLTVENEPSSGTLTLTPGGAYGQVTLDAYTITFDVEGEQLSPVQGALHVVIATGNSATFTVVLVPAQAKLEPPLSSLLISGGELQADATITLSGTEQTSAERVTVSASIRVSFANWADD
jgi:hypothetical protein